MQLMEFFSSASHAITLGPWDLADRTERGLKISKFYTCLLGYLLTFLFRDFGPNYLFHLFAVPIPYFLCGVIFWMGGVLASPPHLLAFSSIRGNFHKSVSFANL